MELNIPEIRIAKNVVDECLKLHDDEIRAHIRNSMEKFIFSIGQRDVGDDHLIRGDLSKLDNRNILYAFLLKQLLLFKDCDMYYEKYLLSEKDREKCRLCIEIINDIIKELSTAGFNGKYEKVWVA